MPHLTIEYSANLEAAGDLPGLCLALRRALLDTGLFEECPAVLVRIVAGVDDAARPGVDQHLGTGQAWLMGDIGSGAFGSDAVKRSLDERVLLGVQRADTVPVDEQMADVVAVGQAGRRAVVAGGQDAPVTHEDATHMRAIAGAALGDSERNLHEVLVPGGALAVAHDVSVRCVAGLHSTARSAKTVASSAASGKLR